MRSPFARRRPGRTADGPSDVSEHAPDDALTGSGGDAGRERRPRHRRLGWLLGGAVVLLLLVAAAWLVITGLLARRELIAVKTELPKLRAAISRGDFDSAQRLSKTLEQHASRAHDLTTGPAWAVSAAIPWAGEPIDTVRVVSEQADHLSSSALPGVLRVATTLRGDSLRTGTRVNLAPIVAARPVLDRASRTAASAARAVRDTSSGTWLGPVDSARASLLDQLARLSSQLTGADQAVSILPTMLGQHGLQRYFVTFENDAESRGVGGLPGAFAIVTADHGTISFTKVANDSAIPHVVRTGLDFGPDFAQKYGSSAPTATFANSDLSPHFPYAGQIWAAMWQKTTGQRIDGALALDPTALSYLLRATGPARMADGEQVGSGNVVALTQQIEYARFDNTLERKAFLVDLAKAVSHRLTSAGNTPGLLREGARAASERRLVVWSRNATVQRVLERYDFAGLVQNTGRPYTGFVVNNAAGSKLDYYLHRSMTYHRTGCGAGSTATATFTMINKAPASGLPPYVTIRADDPKHPHQVGSNKLLVSYYASAGARITSVTINGRPYTLGEQPENGLVTVTVDLTIPLRTPVVMTVTIAEPPAKGPLQVLEQPGVNPMPVTISGDSCR